MMMMMIKNRYAYSTNVINLLSCGQQRSEAPDVVIASYSQNAPNTSVWEYNVSKKTHQLWQAVVSISMD